MPTPGIPFEMRCRHRACRARLISGRILLLAVLSSVSLVAHGGAAATDWVEPAGWVEKVHLLPGEIPLKAKLDTGAKTSSLHAEDISLFERDGAKWVRFQLRLTDAEDKPHDLTIERPRVRRVRIKEHEGEYDRRPVIEMRFCLGGKVHEAEFTLTDRGRFVYPVLLGRRFLADFAPVDSRKTFTRKAPCPPSATAQP